MSEPRQTAHSVNPPIDEAEEIEVDRSAFGPGVVRFKIDFERSEFERLCAGYTRGPEGYARFIKRAALDLADREAKRKAEGRRRESARATDYPDCAVRATEAGDGDAGLKLCRRESRDLTCWVCISGSEVLVYG